LGVAKDQRLSLNPSQISGACGRLMCCLRYEHEFYAQSRKRFPKEGKAVRTKRGDEKVLSNDIFRERVTLRGDDGEVRTIPLGELHAEAEAIGVPLPVPTGTLAPTSSVEDEPIDVELRLDTEEMEVPVIELRAEVTAEAPVETSTPVGASPAADREGRPHRRRGRRGGKRNRPGGRGPRDGSGNGQSSPPESES
jgi:hypothetical protein